MILIVGLGNPGEKYINNRHNAGFIFVDYLAKHAEVIKPWKFDKYSNADVSTINLPTTHNQQLTTLLAKPQTFMNKSGEAVKKNFGNWKLEIGNLIIAHDDLDLELGNFKIQKGTGPKVHNGLSSIEETLGSTDFLRIRIGIDNRKGEFRLPGETYVLQNFNNDEKNLLQETFPRILDQFLISLK